MNLFLPYPEDLTRNAMAIDDRRLNKQVLEAYQIGSVIVRKLLGESPAWGNHPATKMVYNDGSPKLPWLKTYIEECDAEWQRRGFMRSLEFLQKIDTVFESAEEFSDLFSYKPVCGFVGMGISILSAPPEEVGLLYRSLLAQKYEADNRPPTWGRLPEPSYLIRAA